MKCLGRDCEQPIKRHLQLLSYRCQAECEGTAYVLAHRSWSTLKRSGMMMMTCWQPSWRRLTLRQSITLSS